MTCDPLDISMHLVWEHKKLLVPTALTVISVLLFAAVIVSLLGSVTDISVLDPVSWAVLGFSVLGLLLLAGLLSAWSLIASRQVLDGKRVDLDSAFVEGAKLFPRLFGMRLVIAAALLIPVAIILFTMLAMILPTLTHPFQVGSLFLGIFILVIGYLVYVGIRIVYATPVLVLDHDSIAGSLRRAMHLSAHHFWRAAGVFFFLAMVGYLISEIQDGAATAFFQALLQPQTAIWLVPVILVLILAESFVAAYEHMYLLAAYRDLVERSAD